jgi:hypothetical protein
MRSPHIAIGAGNLDPNYVTGGSVGAGPETCIYLQFPSLTAG